MCLYYGIMVRECLDFAVVNLYSFILQTDAFNLQQVIFTPALSNPLFSQFGKGINKIGQVIYSVADENQMEGKFLARFKGLLLCNWRFNDKGVWYLWVEPKHLGILRRWGFKDIRVNAFLLQKAVIAFLALDHTDDPFKGVSKAAAKGRTFIGREAYVLFGADGESEFCQPKCFEHIDQTNRN